MDISDFIIPKVPRLAIYIPNFITPAEEQQILQYVDSAPKPKWTQLAHRRLLNYGGIPHPNGMIAEAIPSWLQSYIDKINNLGIFDSKKANHVLVNEYLPGQGIMAHFDGPMFYSTISTISCGSHTILEFHEPPKDYKDTNETMNRQEANALDTEKVESVSSGKTRLAFKILVEPRSLLVLKEDCYLKYMHSISELESDVIDDYIGNLNLCATTYKLGEKVNRGKRVSLTIRHVPKTTRLKINLGK